MNQPSDLRGFAVIRKPGCKNKVVSVIWGFSNDGSNEALNESPDPDVPGENITDQG